MAKPVSERRPAGLQILRNGARGSIAKPRIVHTHSPKIYKIKPEEFLDLVQKLTGRSCDSEVDVSGTSTSGCSTLKSQDSIDSRSSGLPREDDDSAIAATPLSTQLLASLPSPRFVTLNFLPMLAPTPTADFNHSRRNARFSLSSAAS